MYKCLVNGFFFKLSSHPVADLFATFLASNCHFACNGKYVTQIHRNVYKVEDR
jgi:hypothetical protein